MVPLLLSTGMAASNVCFVAPLFFGFAHVHHAVQKLHQGNDFVAVVLVTTFQFVYTTLFGAYASYTYQRSASLPAVVLIHSMCNAFGIPDLSFLEPSSSVYPYRMILLACLLFGIVSFALFMALLILPPLTIGV
jgi:prenyl protein peptidase